MKIIIIRFLNTEHVLMLKYWHIDMKLNVLLLNLDGNCSFFSHDYFLLTDILFLEIDQVKMSENVRLSIFLGLGHLMPVKKELLYDFELDADVALVL